MDAIAQMHSRPSADLFKELHEATNAMSSAVSTSRTQAHDHDKRALELLERIAERFSGLARLAMMTREAFRAECEAQSRSK